MSARPSSAPSGDPVGRGPDEPAVPWRGGRVVGEVLLIYFASLLLGQVIVAVAAGGGADVDDLTPLLLVLSPTLLLLVTAGWLWLRYGRAARLVVGSRPLTARAVGIGAALGLACFLAQRLLVIVVAAVLAAFGAELPQVQQTFRDVAADPATAPVLALSAVLLAPIAEEVVFRGLLFRGLAAQGFAVAAVVSAALFTLPHLAVTGTAAENLTIVAGIFPLGIAFAAILARWRSLATVIVTHATYNAIGVVLLVLLPQTT